jgi:Domain of unknown function (DUF1707)
MAGPGDEKAAGTTGSGHLRASHADREHVIDTLKAAFAQGRLTKDEFDLRIGQTLAARTYAELATVTADIPAGLTGARPLRKAARARARRPVNKAVVWGACGFITPAIFAGVFADNHLAWITLAPLTFFYFIGWLVAGIVMLVSWHQKLTRADGAGAQPLRKPAKARARVAKAAAWGLYGIIMPAAVWVAVIPGHTTVWVMVTYAIVVYSLFWVLGTVVILAPRLSWTRPYVEQLRGQAPDHLAP